MALQTDLRKKRTRNQKKIIHCRDNLEITADPKEIDHAHRLGRHNPNHIAP